MRKISIIDARKAFVESITEKIGFPPQNKSITVQAISGDKVVIQVNTKYYTFGYKQSVEVTELAEIPEDDAVKLILELEKSDDEEKAPEPKTANDKKAITPGTPSDKQAH